MTLTRTASLLSLGLIVGLAVSGCGSPSVEQTPTPSATQSPTATATPSAPPSDAPPSAPTTAPPTEWTEAQLTTACADFQADWAEGEGLAADDFEWTTPASTQQDGDVWYVLLQGTVTAPDGSAIPAEFTCAVSGSPGSPTVTQPISD